MRDVSPRKVRDPRSPVIVGVGQYVHRPDNPDPTDPLDLMAEAVRSAADDAGLGGIPSTVDSLRVVSLLSWRYGNPAQLLAAQIGVRPPNWRARRWEATRRSRS